jgi:hypothetical protein
MMTPLTLASTSVRMHQVCAGSGEPVLFLHGMPTSCHLWDRVISRLRGQFSCIAVDLPGFGHTPRLARGFRELDALAAFIETLRIERGIERWHMVGHDAGCAIAVEYAHHYPHRLDASRSSRHRSFPISSHFLFLRFCANPWWARSWPRLLICSSGSWLCGWLWKKTPISTVTATILCATFMLLSTDSPAHGV